MKKQLLSLIILSIFANAEDVSLVTKDKILIKNKEEKLNDLSLFLGKKEIVNKSKKAYSSSNSYQNESDAEVENYKKVSLMDVVLETVSTSDLLKASREKVIQSEIKLRDAIADYYPTLNFEYVTGRTKATNVQDRNFKYFNDRNYKFILNQNLYSGGLTNNNIKNLKKKLDLTKNQYYLVLSEQVTKAIKAYFDVVFSYRTVLTAKSNMKQLNKILDIVTIKYENGAASIGDLTAIKANVSNAQTQLIKVKSKFIESLRYYEYIVGEVYLETLPYEKNFNINVSTFDLLLERALKRNKELVNYYESIEAEKFNLKSKESNFLPKVDLEISLDNVVDKENFETREEALNGLVTLSYNLYNGGRDENKVLNSYSAIRELNFKLDEEKRKLKWNVSKLFTAINSTNESLKSNISEVISLRKMVEAYWEEFKLGDQDLQVLLQGQKQLNSAELELINYEKNNITDFFTLLKYTGDLLAFFDIDPEHPKFIDFSKSGYTQDIYIDDKFLNEKEKIERQEELDAQEKAKDVLVSKALQEENIINFLSRFLSSNDEFYTIDIGLFSNLLQANDFIKSNKYDKESFSYDIVNDLDINSKITYGIYKNKDLAQNQLDKLKEKYSKKEFSLKKVKDVKKLYNDYLNGLKVQVKPVPPEIKIVEKVNTIEKIKQVKKEEKFNLSNEFKAKFLSVNPDYYTINITSFNDMKDLENILIDNINLYDNSFAYYYLDSKKLLKWVYGIFETYEDAQKALDNLGEIKTKYYPIIQKISKEQATYTLNLDLNLDEKEQEPNYEYINVSSKTVYKEPVSLKDIDLSKNKALKSKVENLLTPEVNNEAKSVIKQEVIETLEKPAELENKDFLKQQNEVIKEEIIEESPKILNKSYNIVETKKFIQKNKDLYTIDIITLQGAKEETINDFLNQYSLLSNVNTLTFISEFDDINNKNITYGLYSNHQEAQEDLKKINPSLLKDFNCSIVQFKTKLFEDIKENIDNKIKDTKEIKISNRIKDIKESDEYLNFKTIDKYNNQDFKFEFLNAPKEYYSILLASVKDELELKYFLDLYDLRKDIFVVKLLDKSKRIKVMYGIFENKEKADESLNKLHKDILEVNRARSEKIYRKQDAYKEYYGHYDLIEDIKGK
jgi:outer membrane protein, adhesin transport system